MMMVFLPGHGPNGIDDGFTGFHIHLADGIIQYHN